jgi:hypothetical protein
MIAQNIIRHFYIACILLIACNSGSPGHQAIKEDSIVNSHTSARENMYKPGRVWIDQLSGASYPLPDTIGGKPVSFYLDNPNVSSLAKAFYKGQFRPMDDDSTTQLLSYVTTTDNTLRPFYRWCLDFTILISDGALGEYPGVPALSYATKFPVEFFDYMDDDTTGQRYKLWTHIIAYSGLGNYERTDAEIENEIINNMDKNCQACNATTKNQIVKFAKAITTAIKRQE